MNHSRSNAPIKFCPSCGEKVGAVYTIKCDEQKHSIRRKDRDQFCVDCGLSLRIL